MFLKDENVQVWVALRYLSKKKPQEGAGGGAYRFIEILNDHSNIYVFAE